MKSPVTTHVLDTAQGRPAAHVSVILERQSKESWLVLGKSETNADGRAADLLKPDDFRPGTYRLTFDTGEYHDGKGFFPHVTITFEVKNTDQHYHVPLLLSPFGYSTYRGS